MYNLKTTQAMRKFWSKSWGFSLLSSTRKYIKSYSWSLKSSPSAYYIKLFMQLKLIYRCIQHNPGQHKEQRRRERSQSEKRNVWFWLLTEISVGWAPKLSPIISVNNFWWENIYHNCPDGDDDCPNYVDVALHHLLQLQQASLNIRWSAINLTLLYNSAKNLTELYNIKLTSLKWGGEKSLKHSWFECFINASSAFLSSSFTSPTSSPALYFLISAL